MTCHVIDFFADVFLPVPVTDGIDVPHALCGLRPLIQLLHLGSVLLPAVQPEAVHLQQPSHQQATKHVETA